MSEKLAANVDKVLSRSSKIIGKHWEDNFYTNKWFECTEKPIESPIEQMVYIAFETLRTVNYLESLEPHTLPNGKEVPRGIRLEPQYKIDNYRVDFFGSYFPHDPSIPESNLIIECDGHSFHERTEPERRYEKQRDRFFQSKGYRVMHFTGSEINANPYKVAAEIIADLLRGEDNELVFGTKALLDSIAEFDPNK